MKRYAMGVFQGGPAMFEQPSGDYVKWADLEAVGRKPPEVPPPSAVNYPDSGFRTDMAALGLWQRHAYDTGGHPYYSAEAVQAYAKARELAVMRSMMDISAEKWLEILRRDNAVAALEELVSSSAGA